MGNDFEWGYQIDDTDNDSANGTNGDGSTNETETETLTNEEDDSFDFFDDLEETERYIAYITFGLNFIFIVTFIIWISYRCCCSKDPNQKILNEISQIFKRNGQVP